MPKWINFAINKEMTGFNNLISEVILKHSLLKKENGRVIVGLSGGADSVCLLKVLTELGYDCVAAHCNFHLRGEESNRDMRHAEDLTGRMGVDLYVKEFNVAERMSRTGESIEMACRSLRYNWFYELLDRERAQAIAVGHHREDQTETFFLNLFRGSGLRGLAGMRYRSDNVVRPLLDVSRQDIEEYLKSKNIEWIIDSTNASDDFLRNRVRNRLLPYMEQLFPGASAGIIKSMQILRENESIYSNSIIELKKKYSGAEKNELDLLRLVREEKNAPTVLYEILRDEGFSRSQTDDMLEAAEHHGGRFKCGNSHEREVDHGILRSPRAFVGLKSETHEIIITRNIHSPVEIEVTRHSIETFKPEFDPHIIYIDEKALEGMAKWTLRRWCRGDRINPFGMKGSKLLSDIFAEMKLSGREKESVWVLTRNDEVVWVVGVRAWNKFTVGPSTKTFLRLHYHKI